MSKYAFVFALFHAIILILEVVRPEASQDILIWCGLGYTLGVITLVRMRFVRE